MKLIKDSKHFLSLYKFQIALVNKFQQFKLHDSNQGINLFLLR